MATAEVPVNIRGFTGINLNVTPEAIKETELVAADNCDLGFAGELKKRPGWLGLATVSAGQDVRLLGQFRTASFSYIIAAVGDALYRSTDGITWTSIAATGYTGAEWGVQYTDKFYIIRKDSTIVEYNGTVLTSLTGTPSGTFAVVHKERLFVLNTLSTTLGSRLYYSAIADFTSFPSTNFLDVQPGDGDVLVGCSVIRDILYCFKANSVWGLYVQGEPISWTLRNVNTELGAVSKWALKQVEDFTYFVSSRGVHRTDGTTFDDISDAIRPELVDRVVSVPTLNLDHAVRYGDRIVFMLHPTATTFAYYTFYFKLDAWTKWPVAGTIKPAFFIEVISGGTLPKGIYAGDDNLESRVYRLTDTNYYQDNGANYTVTITTKAFNFDAPAEIKRGKWLAVEISSPIGTTLTYITDDVVKTASILLGTTAMNEVKASGPGFFRKLTIKIVNISNSNFTFLGFTLFIHAKRPLHRARL